MGDKETLAKARIGLEELYLGIPDESVNLTFEDLSELKQIANDESAKKNAAAMEEPVSELKSAAALAKLPSLDFARGLQAVAHNHHRRNNDLDFSEIPLRREAYVDVSGISMTSMQQDRCFRRRSGIPHSNICTICSTYIYIFRRRCLVCGRVYCRQCVSRGMGEMTEGRKCVDCLGRRFSHRYIVRAGQVECWGWGYPTGMKEAELKWAEKGPRRRGDRGGSNDRRSAAVSSTRSRSPMTPTGAPAHSFISSSSYSPYSPTHRHQLPF